LYNLKSNLQPASRETAFERNLPENLSMSLRLALFLPALITCQSALGQLKVLTRVEAEDWWFPRGKIALAHIVDGDGRWSLTSVANAARPKDSLVFWGTGFRSAADLEVIVGNRPATVRYAGVSGCCSQLDQVEIEIPDGIDGCFVPVWFRLRETRQTSQVNIAIAPDGGRCLDLPSDAIDKLAREGALWMGFVSPNLGIAAFGRVPFLGPAPMGTCRLDYIPPGQTELSYGDYNRSMVADAVNVLGPDGLSVWPWLFWGGMYASREAFTDRISARAGAYTVDNGPAGYNFRPFRAGFSVPNLDFVWTNRTAITPLKRGEGLQVTWKGGDPAHGFAVIFGETFTCFEDVRKGSFTIPPYVLDFVTRPLRLTVAFQSDWRRLTFGIPELDLAFASYHIGSTQLLEIE
jgi:hypothetical protein